MSFIKFIKSKAFIKHFGIAILLSLVFLWLTLQALNIYTQHGSEIEVIDLTGMQVNELPKAEMDGVFDYVVIDSVYDDHFNKGEIVLQDPLPGSKVKSGRKIYITIVASQPEMVQMPNLVDLSLRQALNELKANSLKLDKLHYVSNFAKNAVLAQMIDGDTVISGTEVLKGSSVELILGKGKNNEKVNVPFLIGMTENEAIRLLNNSSLNVGYLKYLDGRDKLHARIYEQQPSIKDDVKVELGSYVDLWFRNELYFNFDSLVEFYNTDTLLMENSDGSTKPE
ncbi:MAG: PASTA domain-containing protein [Bacteroidales bacterium]|nr:PASTA domain-containing protein [Bacteroidales bacterium]